MHLVMWNLEVLEAFIDFLCYSSSLKHLLRHKKWLLKHEMSSFVEALTKSHC